LVEVAAVVVEDVPEVVVAVVAVVAVLDVSVAVPLGIAEVVVEELIAPESVVDIVPVVEEVSELTVVVALTPVSVVSVFTFSSFLQPTAKIATANRATRVTMRDFFIFNSP
jgi:hypothetical protein